MKKLKGHKPACKCVGCSAATRARGMKALGLGKNRRVRNPHEHRRAVAKSIKRHAKKGHKKGLRKFMRDHRKRRAPNPAVHSIGTSPVVHARGKFSFPGARLLTGPGEHRATISGIRGNRYPKAGAVVRIIDYRNDPKALRAYGRRAPFRHRFTSPARVLSSGAGRIVLESSRRIWERQ